MSGKSGESHGKAPEWVGAREKLKHPPLEEKLSNDELFLLEILSSQRKLLDQIMAEFNAPRKATGKEPASREQIVLMLKALEEKGFVNKIEVWEITSKGKRYLEEI